MDRVIVTVKRVGEFDEYDVELPAHVPAAELIPAVARAMQWDVQGGGQPARYKVTVLPQHHTLEAAETLAQAGAWDGCFLFFSPLSGEEIRAAAVKESPIKGNREGFRWKRIDGEQ